MNAQALADDLNDLLAGETRSLARHIDVATPHITPKTYRAWTKIKHFADISRHHAERLSDLLAALEAPSRPGPYALEVANYHYMRLDFLLPKLVEERRRQIAAYERALENAGQDEYLAGELADLLAQNRELLAQLESLLPTENAA